MSAITKDQFQMLCTYIYKLCGLVIPEEKTYLVTQRLDPILHQLECRDLAGLCALIQSGAPQHINEKIIAAITTNETFFFRDGHPFETFADAILPQLLRLVRARKSRPHPRSGPKVRIWSAAASTGQEAYSIAMLIAEAVGLYGGAGLALDDFEIMATDISGGVMAKAINGVYTDFEINRGLSQARRDRFFTHEPGGNWRVEPLIQKIITFRCCNLLEPLSWLGAFDCIFCRNLLIYFDNVTKSKICQQFHQMLTEQAPLFLGASENLMFLERKEDLFKTIHASESIYYAKNPRE